MHLSERPNICGFKQTPLKEPETVELIRMRPVEPALNHLQHLTKPETNF